jgi:receptor protein-tyrosine kinase
MNASPESMPHAVDKSLIDELISLWGLSAESVERIADVVRTERLSFSDAAVRLGLVSREDLEDARAWMGRRDDNPGPIETAIRQAKSRNSIVLRQAGVVRPGSHLLLLHEPDSARSERIRALRTELMLLVGEARRDNVLALLSPGPAEGRSQLCAELAVSFAQAGRRTLLVDADMRHPRQHVLFNADNQWGLAQALALDESPSMYAVEGVPELSLLTAGAVPPNPLELVSNRRFERLMDNWRRSYDFVLLDTPSVSQYADGLAIATAATRVLLVSRTESTSYSGIKDLLRRLAPTQARILGAVLNRF